MKPSLHPIVDRTLSRLGPLLALAVVYALFAALRFNTFTTWSNTAIMLQQTAVTGVAALGMTLVIVSGGIDLSVGSTVALVSVVLAVALDHGVPPLAALALSLGAGIACGAVSGLLVARLRLMPFIATLGMMGVLRGAAKGLAGEQPVYPAETWINDLMMMRAHGLPPGVWIMLGLAVATALLLRYTRFGRHVFAIGSNEQTARLCGVRVERTKLLVYSAAAGFAGLSGVLQFAYLTGGDPTTAAGLELGVIAAVVIGGASLSGGQGTVGGTLVGALIMTVIASGCTKLGLPNWVQEIVTGGIIVGAALLDRLRRRERD
jgi:ribose/xylose/arabinose/galactoside ABC-type transport system permease subunit